MPDLGIGRDRGKQQRTVADGGVALEAEQRRWLVRGQLEHHRPLR